MERHEEREVESLWTLEETANFLHIHPNQVPRLEKAATRMMTGFQKCQNDSKMQALIRQLSA